MRFYTLMKALQMDLSQVGVRAVAPRPDHAGGLGIVEKRAASLEHFRVISERRTRALLVVNQAKDHQHDYIGPNTLAEIAVAISAGKSVYLLYGYPQDCADELMAWGVRAFEGDIRRLNEELGCRRALRPGVEYHRIIRALEDHNATEWLSSKN